MELTAIAPWVHVRHGGTSARVVGTAVAAFTLRDKLKRELRVPWEGTRVTQVGDVGLPSCGGTDRWAALSLASLSRESIKEGSGQSQALLSIWCVQEAGASCEYGVPLRAWLAWCCAVDAPGRAGQAWNLVGCIFRRRGYLEGRACTAALTLCTALRQERGGEMHI